jgi:hydroxymethylglutaryl-CoA reductase (NADPH)
LPQLIVGTLGGGTGQATKREFREMLRCRGTGRADELAEICTGVAY